VARALQADWRAHATIIVRKIKVLFISPSESQECQVGVVSLQPESHQGTRRAPCKRVRRERFIKTTREDPRETALV
jgi:hypothetical protein